MNGYASKEYAESLRFYGLPYRLPRSGGWLLSRHIGNTGYHDAMGCYPVFCCENWDGLAADVEEMLGYTWVSVVLVTDPFAEPDLAVFTTAKQFKEHYVANLSLPLAPTKHHLRHVRQGEKGGYQFSRCDNSLEFSDEWVDLYSNLVRRHNIIGMTAFNDQVLRKQLAVPGTVVFRAHKDGRTVSMLVFYVQGKVAYYHLGASSEEGYHWHASYGLFALALELLRQDGVVLVDLGGAPGTGDGGGNSLATFKAGWANDRAFTYLCCLVIRNFVYRNLTPEGYEGEYFPAYRDGEFK